MPGSNKPATTTTAKNTARGSDDKDTEEEQNMYMNVEKDSDQDSTSSYQNVEEYLNNRSIDHEEGEGPHDHDSTLYYNLPDLMKPNVDREEEDDVYVYMKSGENIDQEPKGDMASAGTGLVPSTGAKKTERKRLISEQTGLNKKYVNFTRDQQLQAAAIAKSASRENIAQQVAKEKEGEEEEGEEEDHLYANYSEAGGKEEEEEELYTEVS